LVGLTPNASDEEQVGVDGLMDIGLNEGEAGGAGQVQMVRIYGKCMLGKGGRREKGNERKGRKMISREYERIKSEPAKK